MALVYVIMVLTVGRGAFPDLIILYIVDVSIHKSSDTFVMIHQVFDKLFKRSFNIAPSNFTDVAINYSFIN